MVLDADFKVRDIREVLDAAHMRGKNITFLNDFSRGKILSFCKAAEMLELFMRMGTDLLKGKVLCTLFFQLSIRMRCLHENAMHRLGGSVITEAEPTHNSFVAKNELLADNLRVTSEYADVIALRRLGRQESARRSRSDRRSLRADHLARLRPSDALGEGPLDSCPCRRAFGDLSNTTVATAVPDLSSVRSGQSFALALAEMGAKSSVRARANCACRKSFARSSSRWARTSKNASTSR